MRCALSALAFLALALPSAAETRSLLSELIILPDEKVDGHSLPDYANLWWQWAGSMPPRLSAVRDETGAHCGEGQTGPVWFLAGGYGSSKISRSCTVPADRHLFFPVINMMQELWPATMEHCPEAMAMVMEQNEVYVFLKVILDGEMLEDPQRFRVTSEQCFDPYALTPVEAGAPQDVIAATDGYWIMLRPLPPGRHSLEFRAFYANPDEDLGEMVQNIRYDLEILSD